MIGLNRFAKHEYWSKLYNKICILLPKKKKNYNDVGTSVNTQVMTNRFYF